jgi:pimeloyl-ACP methyl ester carboxylesterase
VSERAFAASNGIRLCYETFGERSNPPMLLIMGLAAQMIVWDDEFCLRLADRGFWVIRFDNRDIGESTRFPNARAPRFAELLFAQATGLRFRVPYTLRDMADDAAGLLDALGVARAHVVGASMGGAIAQELAIAHPARVRSLTSIMSSTGDPKLPGPRPKALARLGKKVPLDRAGYVREYVTTWSIIAGDHFPFDADRRVGEPHACLARAARPHAGDPRDGRSAGPGRRRPRDSRRDPRRAASPHRRNGTLVSPRSVAHHHRRDRPSCCAGRRVTCARRTL